MARWFGVYFRLMPLSFSTALMLPDNNAHRIMLP